jgi:predicted glycoside hydrolase/deacetylase ChbG (UPF0249 family)
MHIHVHHHYSWDEIPPWVADLHDKLDLILQNQESIMSTLQDAQAAQAATDEKLSAVKADVEALLAKVSNIPSPGTLSPDQQVAVDDIVAHANKINDSLSGIDAEANPPPVS